MAKIFERHRNDGERGGAWRATRARAGRGVAIGLALCFAASGCDSTAKFRLPDRKFSEIQVVTAFPAYIDDSGAMVRVCGPALDGEVVPQPNAVELNVNFVSTALKETACPGDKDRAIKEGELIELTPLRTTGALSTVSDQNFKMQLDCAEPRGATAGASCPTGIQGSGLKPAKIAYAANTARCDPNRPETWLNIALLVDNSGSTTGLVDPTTNREDNPLPDTPQTLTPSDPFDARIDAAKDLLKELNDRDRVIAYQFNEKFPGVVAASDNRGCLGDKDGKACVSDADCGKGSCVAGENAQGNSFEFMSQADAQKKAFGSGANKRALIETALEHASIKDGGEGRAPLWQALDVAYQHLKGAVTQNRHIIVLTDGPDTCTHGEALTYTSSDGKCRTACQNADVDFALLRQRMAEDGHPVQIHFIQWQAPGYKEPDAQMMEIACRSGGTYQFLNFSEINNSDAQQLRSTMRKAMFRLRYALGGSWRVGVKLNSMKDEVATGEVWAMAGYLMFENQLFPSLSTLYSETSSWKFGFDAGNEDRRLVFRKACGGAADCGGSDACGANHCTSGGLCRSKNAPDKQPCSSGSVCCSGVCSADCPAACQ